MTLSSLISRVEEGSELASASVRPEPSSEGALQIAVDVFRVAHASNGGNLHASLRRAFLAYQERGSEVVEALEQCEEYFDNKADADCDQDGFIPNKEMRLLSVVRGALKALEDSKAGLADAHSKDIP